MASRQIINPTLMTNMLVF